MERAAWLSDIHLDSCTDHALERLFDSLIADEPDCVLIGGDIANAHILESRLLMLAGELNAPIYFVLGNHDFYGGSFDEVRARVRRLCESERRLHFLLDHEEPVALTEKIGLVACGDWADGRLGDYWGSRVMLNDFLLIRDFAARPKHGQYALLNHLGDNAAERLDRRLATATARYVLTIVLLHVPPYREAAWHEGMPSSDDFLPFFSCKAVGDVLDRHFGPNRSALGLVLCGHTHGAGIYRRFPNLKVITAGAEYGEPTVQRVLDLSSPEKAFSTD